MEGLVTQKVTPLLKCVVLFLFIFTAKVLTSRPQESQDIRNSIHQVRPSHYVRTFTKYHHRRTFQKNNQDWSNYWPVQEPKSYGKRSIDYIEYDWPLTEYNDNENDPANIDNLKPKVIKKRSPDYSKFKTYWQLYKRSVDSSELVGSNEDVTNSKQLTSEDVKDNSVSSNEKAIVTVGKEKAIIKNGIPYDIKKYKVKAAIVITDAPTTMGPTISCLYKIHNVAMSVTPSYDDERNAQLMVENDSFDTGPISKMTLSNGDVVQVEQCTDTRASCYTLWHNNSEGNITVLGQGCWRSSQTEGRNSCDKVTARLPGTKVCYCTKSYCNADFTSLKEETVTVKAESTMNTASQQPSYSNIVASAILAFVAILVMAVVVKKFYCRVMDVDKEDLSDATDVEKGDIMGNGPDALATGLSCVDNLTLIEHIGQGKFGSVWRGSLGSNPVAVKLYSNASTWQKEASVYSLPHLAHPNILRYYGSETRARLTEGGGREHLVVVELCAGTLRARLRAAPLSWLQFASLARGLAAALAHLHAQVGNKPCVVHRDVNTNNVLIAGNGEARLADLGLAQALHPRRENTAPSRITEAGTLRYLAPEALEGALDLSGARAALCAVDVFALGLVLWEMLWRTRGAHTQPVPPYALPYHHHGLPLKPTLAQMQSLVSRNKARPPLPAGPVPEPRALRVAADTCDECWDHDAEARLTAVCVEERMAELKQMLQAQAPVIHDNNLHPHTYSHPSVDVSSSSPQESDKNSNCTVQNVCDVTTPLLYPQPHIGRNACIERNTNTQQHTVELIHKSLKDITAPTDIVQNIRVQNIEEQCLSVARVSHRPQLLENSLNEIRSYQRPLEYVQNDVTSHDLDRGPKQTNLLQEAKTDKSKWGFKKFFEKFHKNKTNVEVKLVPETVHTKVALLTEKPLHVNRPSNLILNQEQTFNLEGPCLSPPNRTLSPNMMDENNVLGFKELPSRDNEAKTPNQIFAVIVPKAKPSDFMEMRTKTSRGSSESLNKQSVRTSMSSQSNFKTNSESEDSTVKKRLSCDNRIITNSNSCGSSRASINLELQYIDNQDTYNQVSPFELNSDCSSSEDEHLMLLSENGGAKITMQTIPKADYQNEVLKETSQAKVVTFNKSQNKYTNFDNEYSDPNDKENLMNGYSGDNPVYLAALNGEIDTAGFTFEDRSPKSPKPALKRLSIKRQHSLEQVSEIFSSSGDVNLLNPAGRVKTPGDLPVAIRRARRDRVLQKGRANECNRLSLYDDRMMFGNSL